MIGDGARRLWLAVILQAVRDATSGTARQREMARAWFNLTNADFIERCSLAGLDPESTVHKAMRAIAESDVNRHAEQAKPMRRRCPAKPPKNARLLTFNGETLRMAEWARRIGIKPQALHFRLTRHPVEVALAMEPRGDQRRGRGQNFRGSKGTGAGKSEEEMQNIRISP